MPLSAAGAAINADFIRSILTMRATVYGRAANGQFATVVRADLPCLLQSVSANAAGSVPDRAALAATRVFRYDASYALPSAPYQIAVDVFPDQRWSPEADTDDVDYVPGIGVIGKTILVERV